MALYYFTADYSGEAFSGMVNSPQDRESAARKLIEAVGMKLHSFYFCVNTGQIVGMIEGSGTQMSTLDMVIMASGAYCLWEQTKYEQKQWEKRKRERRKNDFKNMP